MSYAVGAWQKGAVWIGNVELNAQCSTRWIDRACRAGDLRLKRALRPLRQGQCASGAHTDISDVVLRHVYKDPDCVRLHDVEQLGFGASSTPRINQTTGIDASRGDHTVERRAHFGELAQLRHSYHIGPRRCQGGLARLHGPDGS